MPQSGHYTVTPSELELLEFFESEPLESEPGNGFWCYEFEDSKGITVRLSCDSHAKSVQTVLLTRGEVVSTVVHEGAEQMEIDHNVLRCSFLLKRATQLEITVQPRVSVNWTSLRTE